MSISGTEHNRLLDEIERLLGLLGTAHALICQAVASRNNGGMTTTPTHDEMRSWLLRFADSTLAGAADQPRKTEKADADNERLRRRIEGATRLLNAWHFEYHHGRRLEGIDDDTTTWLGGIDLPGSAADQPAAAPCGHIWVYSTSVRDWECTKCGRRGRTADNSPAGQEG